MPSPNPFRLFALQGINNRCAAAASLPRLYSSVSNRQIFLLWHSVERPICWQFGGDRYWMRLGLFDSASSAGAAAVDEDSQFEAQDRQKRQLIILQ